jgi:pyruvate, water dikinase
MKTCAVVINTSRGGVIDNQALVRGLAEGKVCGAGLDVLSEEPVIREEAELLRSVYEREHNLYASLGEMIRELKAQGVRVPGGFATTAEACRRFLEANELEPAIREQMDRLHADSGALAEVGKTLRRLFRKARLPDQIDAALREEYRALCEKHDQPDMDVAVRSSATAEDLPEASFAGQHETFLNITGEDELLKACRKCYASLFTDRAIAYREEQGFDHLDVSLSVGVQKMVRADKAGSGVMFSIDTETGFPHVVVINAAWGLGENVVQGTVHPDEYRVFKPLLGKEGRKPIIEKSLGAKEQQMVYATGDSEKTKNVDTPKHKRREFVPSDDEVLLLACWAVVIEDHCNKPMDIEWAKDGTSGELFIVQARPETVQSQKTALSLKRYRLNERGDALTTGLAIGQGIAAGKACVIRSVDEIDRFEDDALLVTEMIDSDWVPIMKRSAGIITEHGGRTSHAAIVGRELGVPAVVGTGNATEAIEHGQEVTLSCAEGDEATVYRGALNYDVQEISLDEIPETRTKVGICGQAPSDYPDFAAFLVEQEIDSLSLNPDSIVDVNKHIAEIEKQVGCRIERTLERAGVT